MPAGLQIINDNGIVQIDGESLNPVLYSKGTTYTTGHGGTFESVPSVADIPIPTGLGDPTFLAIRPGASDAYACPMGTSSGNQRFVTNMAIGSAVEWWLFSRPAVVTSAGFGLDIFGPAGELVYSMGMKPMRIVQLKQFAGTWGETAVYNGPTGKYAAVFGGYAGGWHWGRTLNESGQTTVPGEGGEETIHYFAQGAGVGVGGISNGLNFGPMMHSDASTAVLPGDPAPQPDMHYASMALVVDVTGY